MSVNMGAVMAELERAISTPNFISSISSSAMMKARQATDLLAGCINSSISVSGSAVAAIGTASASETTQESGVPPLGGTINYSGSVDMPQNYRPSLDPGKYGGVDDMAALFDKGYDAGGQVIGEWHGVIISSLQHRQALHFVQAGVDAFNSSYGAPYNAHAETSGRF